MNKEFGLPTPEIEIRDRQNVEIFLNFSWANITAETEQDLVPPELAVYLRHRYGGEWEVK